MMPPFAQDADRFSCEESGGLEAAGAAHRMSLYGLAEASGDVAVASGEDVAGFRVQEGVRGGTFFCVFARSSHGECITQ